VASTPTVRGVGSLASFPSVVPPCAPALAMLTPGFPYLSGFEKPSAIQQRAIVPFIKGRDLIAQSQSGTGKTAVFSIGTLQSLDLSTTETQALSAWMAPP
jgi:hypothetical protein